MYAFALSIFSQTLINLIQLFDFVDLTGFSLILKNGFYESHIDMFLDGS